MKKIFVTMFCLSLAAPLFADGTNQLTDEISRASYAYGLLNGSHSKAQWKAQDVGFKPDLFLQGLKDGLVGGTPLMTEAEAQQVMKTFQTEFQEQKMAKLKGEGEAFLATNKLAPGIKLLSVALPNGQTSELQYLVVSNGTGPIPKATDRVSVNYRGMLLDGTEFDSSHGQPASFPVNHVIPGWTSALENMPVGSAWKLFIPSELAYGDRGAGQKIPPNSVLIFDVSLVGIAPPAPPPAPAQAPVPLSSDIIKVPSMEEMKKGAQPETIKQEDLPKYIQQQQTNK